MPSVSGGRQAVLESSRQPTADHLPEQALLRESDYQDGPSAQFLHRRARDTVVAVCGAYASRRFGGKPLGIPSSGGRSFEAVFGSVGAGDRCVWGFGAVVFVPVSKEI